MVRVHRARPRRSGVVRDRGVRREVASGRGGSAAASASVLVLVRKSRRRRSTSPRR